MKRAQPLMISWLIILIGLVSVFTGCAAKAPGTAAQPGPQVQLNKIESREVDGKVEITIEGTEPILQYTSFQLTEPLRLVVDITDANIGSFQEKIPVNRGVITDIMPSQKDNVARLEIFLAQAVDSKVSQAGGKLMVELAKPGETAQASPEALTPTPAPPAPETAKQEEPKQEKVEAAQPEKAMAKVVSTVRASAGKDGVKVIVTGDGAMSPKTFMLKDNRLVVDIPGAKSKVRPSVIPVRKGGLARVRVAQYKEDVVRVVMDLTKPLKYTVTPEGNTLIIAMNAAATSASEAKQEEKAPQERAAQEPAKSPVAETEKEAVQPQAQESEAAVAPVTAPKVPAEAVKREPGSPGAELNVNKFTGKKISLDLQDADLINVMRLFADVANLNIILAPDVKGRVTVRMVNIPWDQAMEIILKMNGLGYALEDNILRIASVQALTKEAEEETRSKEAKKKAEDLITRIIPVNYSTAATVEATIKKSLSARGETMTDIRTNTIIVKDIAKNVDEVASLIKLLDKPIPQIMIEARIVEATLNFSRSVGVQWGGTAKFDATHGNALNTTFPNTIGVTGGPQMGATPSGNGNFLVNMPAPAGAGTGGGAIGFTFGSLSKALNLDLVLSALESAGEGKVISTPRISALDNKEAKIEQGVSIPFSTASASGTSIQFIDAKLSLVVTPHATPDNKIFLKIQATKNAPDTSILGGGQPSIQKNEATTEILLTDGETAVIGGILIVDQGVTDTKVPFFGDIPFIGWLFKSRSRTETKRELLIFITPKIMVQEVI